MRTIKYILKSSSVTFVCYLLLIFTSNAYAQVNYVHNPSFEQYSQCPNAWDQIKFANFWSASDSTNTGTCIPEYCNSCAGTNIDVGIPYSLSYYHYPRTGNGMAQVQMFYDENSATFPVKRDYLQGRFYKSLVANKSYCVTFYVALEQESEYAINHIGAYLDNGQIDTSTSNCDKPQIQYTPQIVETTIINDTLNWVKIEGTFTATGNEKFITIGNFFNKTNTNYTIFDSWHLASGCSWYLVDDVSVIESDTKAFAWGTDTLHKGYLDSFLLGRDETIPGIKWYRDGVLIDTLNAGIWCKDNVLNSHHIYVVSQILCGLTTYDTVVVSVEMVSSGVNVNSEHLQENGVSVYPNPAKDEIMIRNTNSNTEPVMMDIYDLSGKKLLEKQIQFPQNDNHVHLDLSSGVYMLKLTDN